jgi:hypothetical protein
VALNRGPSMLEETLAWRIQRRAQARVISDREIELRRLAQDEATASLSPAETLTRWARALELALLFASLQEAVTRLGLVTTADVVREHTQVDALVVTLSRLDPLKVTRENQQFLAPLRQLQPPADGPASVDMGLVLTSVRSLLLHCPISLLDRAGHDHALAELAHRCHIAFDGLTAFLARNSRPQADALHAAGRACAEGRLSIDEVATVLGIAPQDAVALLEEQGFRRSIREVRLQEAARNDKLRAIREERIARRGEPDLREDLVAREVIASQRIEDIDARPWLKT